jgi:hypothetical protein
MYANQHVGGGRYIMRLAGYGTTNVGNKHWVI